MFGLNTLVALCVQTGLSLVVASEYGFALDIREQFVCYASYFIVLSVFNGLFAVIIAIRKEICKENLNKSHNNGKRYSLLNIEMTETECK